MAGIAARRERRRARAAAPLNARTEILAGADRRSARWSAPAACSRRTGTGTRTSARRRSSGSSSRGTAGSSTLTEAGILGKIGLNDAGLGVCLNLLSTTADGGRDGTPIHVLLRQMLQSCRSVDDAIELLDASAASAPPRR